MTNIISRDTVPTVYVYLNTPVSSVTGNGTTYGILFDSTVTGYSSTGYNSGTGIYTVSVPGNYLVCTSIQYTNIINGANGNLSAITTTLNGYRLSEIACTAAKDSSNRFGTNGMVINNLSAGDTIRVYAQLNNGSAASVGLGGGTSPYLTWLYIKYLS